MAFLRKDRLQRAPLLLLAAASIPVGYWVTKDVIRENFIDEPFPDHAAAIKKGDIDLGMTEEMVLAAVGKPAGVSAELAPDGARTKTWTYRRLGLFTRLRVTLRDGVVVGVAK